MDYTPVHKLRAPNQLYRELLSVNGLNPWDGCDSASRKQMFASHLGQTLVVSGATERFCQTGMEREFGKYTFSVKMPTDGKILKVIPRYREKIGPKSIAKNPQTIVIYESENTKQVGIINLTDFCSYHQYFGFKYEKCPGLQQLVINGPVKEGEIFLNSPAVTQDGGYKYGVECNIAYMSHPAVSEDGILICRDVLKKFSFKTYETRVVEFGSKRFPLNMYGTVDNFKPFPDIGDRVREDGLLMVLRAYDKSLAVVEQGVHDLMEPDFIYDKLTYAPPGGRIIDIRIQHDTNSAKPTTPLGMEAQAEKYDEARRSFYQEIIAEWSRLKREREDLQLTPEFQRLLVEALSVVGTKTLNNVHPEDKQRTVKLYRQNPLDDWRIEFVIEYDIVPTIGFKMTGCHGNKGVICHIAEPHEMPIDENGNRADIVMDPNSIISRMNLGQLYEQYINAASRDVAAKIRLDLQLERGDIGAMMKISAMESTSSERIERAWAYLMGYYQIVSPRMFVWFTSGQYKRTRAEHLADVVNKGIYLYLPPENDPEYPEMVEQLERLYRPVYGPVSYIGNSGVRVTTKNPVRIGSVYMLLLEKTADDWTAVSSGKLQHFGVLSQVTNADKYSQPNRVQAIRAFGEAEVRIAVSYTGPYITADILDRNNNPATHKQMLQKILEADRPTDIAYAVDRSILPMGGSKPLQLINHIGVTGGWRFVYKPYKPNY